jgi:hypothetical protein
METMMITHHDSLGIPIIHTNMPRSAPSQIFLCLFPILLCMHSLPKWSAPHSPALETVGDIMHRLSLLLGPGLLLRRVTA